MAPGLGLGLGLAAGCVLTALGGRLAAVLGFSWVVGVGFVGAWALAAAGLLAVGAGLEARLGGVPRGLGGGVLDEDVVVVVDEVVVVVEVVVVNTLTRTSRAWLACGGVNPVGNVLSHCKCFSRFKP